MNSNHLAQGSTVQQWRISVHTEGHIDNWAEEHCMDMKIDYRLDGTTLIEGTLVDLPAVYGFINRLRDGVIALRSLQVARVDSS